MAAAITSVSPTPATTGAPTDALSKINSGDFIKVMLAQLQQQDPLNPSDSNQLLTQLSQIEQLQSSTSLNTTLQGLSLQQSMAAGAGMMGKLVTGLDINGNQINGQVTSVQVQNQNIILGLASGQSLPLTNITQVTNPPTVTTSATNSSLLGSSLLGSSVLGALPAISNSSTTPTPTVPTPLSTGKVL